MYWILYMYQKLQYVGEINLIGSFNLIFVIDLKIFKLLTHFKMNLACHKITARHMPQHINLACQKITARHMPLHIDLACHKITAGICHITLIINDEIRNYKYYFIMRYELVYI